MKFYTNVAQKGQNILVVGYQDGKRFQQKVPYNPYLFVKSNKPSKYKTLAGESVEKLDFNNTYEAKQFVEQYKNVSGFEIYGMTNWLYVYINDAYPGEIDFDPKQISVVTIDIEVAADEGFPSVDLATKPITAITLRKNGKSVVLGCGEYTPQSPDVKYVQCDDESHLLKMFLQVWQSPSFKPDVVTGWNVEMFDIPYIHNRISNILDEKEANKLSPWGYVEDREIKLGTGISYIAKTIVGVTILDYLQLYKKFSYTPQESYRLDHVANYELGEKKLDYSEYDSLLDLYKKDYQKFIDYNVKDCELVDKLDDKLKFVEQVFTLAYDGKVNYVDTFTTVRMWDIIIHNYLHGNNIVVPQVKIPEKDDPIVGAYVKDPNVGMHKWVVSFDLNSLYPHLIMQYNISPETYITTIEDVSIDGALKGQYKDPEIQAILNSNNTIAATGCVFTKDFQGFLPKLMERVYNDRTKYKKMMIEAKKEYQENPSYEVEKRIARYNNLQMAKKIQLNSCYGALGNMFFRWFDPKYAESITKSGQLSIRWVEQRMNKYLNNVLNTSNVDYVLACDTDSMYLTLDNLVQQTCQGKTTEQTVNIVDKFCQKALEPFIDKCYQELATYVNAYDQKMKMKRECIADKGIWTAKKRYILNVWDQEGVRYQKPKMKLQGIEAVRSSTPSACRDNIKKCLEIIINGDEQQVIDFIEAFRMEFRQLPFEDIAFPRGVKDLDKYSDKVAIYTKGTPIHTKGALLFNHLIERKGLSNRYQKISNGDKIKFCYLKSPNPVKCNVISVQSVLPDSLGLSQYIDHDTQFDKAFLEPVKTVLDTIGWKTEKQSTLEDFFK